MFELSSEVGHGQLDEAFNLVWLILLAPLAGFLINAAFGGTIVKLCGKKVGRWISGLIGVLPIVIAFGATIVITQDLANLNEHSRVVISTWFNWIDLQTLTVPFELRVDPLSMTMCLIVTGVGALIHIYATGYMADDRDYPRFFTYLNLFIAFMLMLVLGNNLALLFIGWEGVGLCSYLLIGFWYENVENAKAANKAFIVNRIGDWGFMLGMFLVFWVFASSTSYLPDGETRFLSFDVILPYAQAVLGQFGDLVVHAIPILLFIGAIGKSAQFPLYMWLPDAMAGPTPVSALIHAATMVTAGVYLVTRTHAFFELAPVSMMIVAGIGAFTAIFAATIAFGQHDIKKVLAYSTVSQLGYMFLACGSGAFAVGMFHVTTHAFFKALLFLGSGAVIMSMAHNQDMRNYGGLWKYIPITYFTMLVGWLAIAGIPPLAGFFSKDEILAATFLNGGGLYYVLYGIGLLTAVLTAAYMTRMFYLTFYGKDERWRQLPKQEHHEHQAEPEPIQDSADEHGFFLKPDEMPAEEEDAHHDLTPDHQPVEVGPAMWVPLVALAALSLVGGAILAGLNPLAHLFGLEVPHYFDLWLHPTTATVMSGVEQAHATPALEWTMIIASVAAAITGIAWMRGRYAYKMPESEKELAGVQALAGNQWQYDRTLYRVFVTGGGRFGDRLYQWFDKAIIDGVFVHGSANLVGGLGLLFRKLQTGYVRYYAMAMLVGVIGVLGYLIFAGSR